MDPAGIGALIGFSVIVCIVVSSSMYEKFCKKKQTTEHTHLIETKPKKTPQMILQTMISKRQSSMREFFEKNTKPNALKVVRIS